MLEKNSISEYIEPKKEKKKEGQSLGDGENKNDFYSEILDNKYNMELSAITRKEVFLKKGSRDVAFTSKGTKIVSSRKMADNVYQDMVLLAQKKQWGAINVSGAKEFRRNVWLEASSKGMKVHGYQPTEQDLRMLERNTQNKSDTPEPKKETKSNVSDRAQQKKEMPKQEALPQKSDEVAAHLVRWKEITEAYAKNVTNNKASQKLLSKNLIERITKMEEQGLNPELKAKVQPIRPEQQVKIAKPEKVRQVASER